MVLLLYQTRCPSDNHAVLTNAVPGSFGIQLEVTSGHVYCIHVGQTEKPSYKKAVHIVTEFHSLERVSRKHIKGFKRLFSFGPLK